MRLRLLFSGMAAAGIGLLGGCTFVHPMRHPAMPGDDPRLLEPGADRAAVEQALGKPIRVWQPNDEVSYGLYLFHDPVKEYDTNRALTAVVDVASAGIAEADMAIVKSEERKQHYDWRPVHLWWIGFDRRGRVFGHFAEYDILPEHRPSVPSPAKAKP